MGKEKIPWYIYHSENEILSLAGLFDEWTSNSTGEELSTFTILTTDANRMMAEIHNSAKRMPVILDKISERKWIDLSYSPDDASDLLKPLPDNILKAHTISPLVNNKNVNRNTPELIQPYSYKPDNLLF